MILVGFFCEELLMGVCFVIEEWILVENDGLLVLIGCIGNIELEGLISFKDEEFVYEGKNDC